MVSKRGSILVACMILLMVIVMFISQVEQLKPFLPVGGDAAFSTATSISAVDSTTFSPDGPYNVSLHNSSTRTDHQGSSNVTVAHDSRNQQRSSNTTKFLQYWVQGGFGNQIACLDTAYLMAWATNRTLILSPIVPHFYLHYHDIMDDTFQIDYDLRELYLSELKSKAYLRVDKALDIKYTLPLVETVDFRDFYDTIYPTLPRSDSWVVESQYHHFNTRWVVDQPELEGTTENIVRLEQRRKRDYNVVVRDLRSVGRAMHDYPIWTLLDSFYALRPGTTAIKPRLCKWIRYAAHRIIHQYNWDGMPYASVHIRGADGPFQKPEAITDAIWYGMESILNLVREWASHSASNYTRVGLFVATDLDYLDSKVLFTRGTRLLNDTLFSMHGTTLEILFSKNIQQGLQELYKTEDNFPYEDLLTPGIFLDQQIAACASIGFVGAQGSTFSLFIEKLRRGRAEDVCQ